MFPTAHGLAVHIGRAHGRKRKARRSGGRPSVSHTVQERILRHLARFHRPADQGHLALYPRYLTQPMIASAVGVSRSHASLALGELVQRGEVDVHVARVDGLRGRRKVYHLHDGPPPQPEQDPIDRLRSALEVLQSRGIRARVTLELEDLP